MSLLNPPEFTPNGELLAVMTAMGIDKRVAENALYNTGNECCDAAVAYVFDKPETSHKATKKRVKKPDRREMLTESNFKMVFVVNTALHMGIGKTAAQVGHASIGLYNMLLSGDDFDDTENANLEKWEEDGSKKVVLKGTNHLQLMELMKHAELLSLQTFLVEDAGLTEVMPGSVTVLGVFGTEEAVDEVTGDLELL